MRWFSENVTPPDRRAKYHPSKTRVTIKMQEIKQQIEDKNRTPLHAAKLLGLSWRQTRRQWQNAVIRERQGSCMASEARGPIRRRRCLPILSHDHRGTLLWAIFPRQIYSRLYIWLTDENNMQLSLISSTSMCYDRLFT
jgi:hypothetical protein